MKKDSKEEVLAYLNEHFADKFSSWADLYARLKGMAKGFTDNPTLPTAAFAVSTLLAFVLAMEELPEEGDVVVIARKMNEILVHRPDATGVVLCFGEDAAELLERMERVASFERGDDGPDSSGTGGGRLLH